MKSPAQRWLAVTIGVFILLPALAFVIVYLWSARVPSRWQELSASMDRNDVAEFLANPSAKTARLPDGRDSWRIDRPIGDWLLLVSYNRDGSFNGAHLRYSSPVGGEYDRARNYTEHDAPYSIRSQR
jgi:hypothetical protein